MILVLVGTNPYPFTRLLQAMDAWAKQSGEHVIAQSGYAPVVGFGIECHPFVSHAKILEWTEQAAVVVCHGGLGSLRDCLRAGKPIVAVPRKRELREARDVQSELVDALAQEGKVIALDNVEDLAQAIEKARHMTVCKPHESCIPQIVAKKIKMVLKHYEKR